MNTSYSPYDVEKVLYRELEAGERLLWSGKPDPRRKAFSALGCWIFAIPWTAFSVFWMWGAMGFGQRPIDFSRGESFFPLFGLPFLLIGIAMLLSPLWAYKSAQNTYYGITNQRVIIVEGGTTRKVSTHLPRDITTLERRERPDGSGDLVFARKVWRDSDGDRRTSDTGLYGIPDVRNVERIIREGLLKGGNSTTITDNGTERI